MQFPTPRCSAVASLCLWLVFLFFVVSPSAHALEDHAGNSALQAALTTLRQQVQAMEGTISRLSDKCKNSAEVEKDADMLDGATIAVNLAALEAPDGAGAFVYCSRALQIMCGWH